MTTTDVWPMHAFKMSDSGALSASSTITPSSTPFACSFTPSSSYSNFDIFRTNSSLLQRDATHQDHALLSTSPITTSMTFTPATAAIPSSASISIGVGFLTPFGSPTPLSQDATCVDTTHAVVSPCHFKSKLISCTQQQEFVFPEPFPSHTSETTSNTARDMPQIEYDKPVTTVLRGGDARSTFTPSSTPTTRAGVDPLAIPPAPFRSSSFMIDPVASPVNDTGLDIAAIKKEWTKRQDEDGDEADIDDDDELDETSEDSNETQQLASPPIGTTANILGASNMDGIGNISTGAMTATSSSQFPSILLPDDFSSVNLMRDVDDVTATQPPHIPSLTSLFPPTRSKRGRKPSSILTKELVSLTPQMPRSNRLTSRRNSELVPVSERNNEAKDKSSPSAPLECDTPPKRLKPVSHKRKKEEEIASTSVDPSKSPIESCPQCQSCSECARHWMIRESSDNSVDDTKHAPTHGHVHSKGNQTSPTITKLSSYANEVPMLISPIIVAASPRNSIQVLPINDHALHEAPTTKSLNATHVVGACCKPNHAVRSGPSLDDSPEHTSLALSPAIRSRRFHHKMIHGHTYEVGELLDVRIMNASHEVYYLVAWKGYPDYFNSWEKESNIRKNCSELIEKFEEERGKIEIEQEGDEENADALEMKENSDDDNDEGDDEYGADQAHSIINVQRIRNQIKEDDEEEHEQELQSAEEYHSIAGFSPIVLPSFINV